jgi:hypothetical protein
MSEVIDDEELLWRPFVKAGDNVTAIWIEIQAM